MFQDCLAYTPSACADHKTVPRRFNHFIGDEVENPFDLGEESSQEPEISAGHPYEHARNSRRAMNRQVALKIVLALVGLLFLALVYPMALFMRQEPALSMMLSSSTAFSFSIAPELLWS